MTALEEAKPIDSSPGYFQEAYIVELTWEKTFKIT